jgi:hypothetical protein
MSWWNNYTDCEYLKTMKEMQELYWYTIFFEPLELHAETIFEIIGNIILRMHPIAFYPGHQEWIAPF